MRAFCLSLVALPILCWGQGPRSGESQVNKLPEELAAKTISLNPEYVVLEIKGKAAEEKLPLLIYLHGAGGIGSDVGKIKRQAEGPARTLRQAGIATLVVAPQATKNPMREGAGGGWVVADLDLLLEHLKATLPVDERRIYLTGNSMGGYGTIMWAGNRPQHFAAIAPMVGGLGPGGPKDVTKDLQLWGKNLAGIPMRAYYGANDKVVPPDRGTMLRQAIDAAGGTKAEIITRDAGHNAGQAIHSDPAFFKWLFSNAK